MITGKALAIPTIHRANILIIQKTSFKKRLENKPIEGQTALPLMRSPPPMHAVQSAPKPAPTKRFLAAVTGHTTDRPPFWLMRQAGRYLPEYRATRAKAGGFLDLCFNPELATEVTLQPIRRYGMDAAILFSDILVVPYGLGQSVAFKAGEGPVLDPVRDEKALEALSLDNLHDRLGPVYETVSKLTRSLPDETALIGFAGSPWTVATYMVEGRGSKDHGTVKGLAYTHPGLFDRLIDLLVDATSAYLSRQIQAGAECVQLFDSWAGALADDQFRRLVIAPTKTIVSRLKAAHPDTPIIGFPRGGGVLLKEYAQSTGVDALALDTAVPPEWAAETLQPILPVQGNLDPALLLAGGAAMTRRIDHLLQVFGQRPYIFNLGHGVTPEVPPEVVAELSARIKTWPDRRAG